MISTSICAACWREHHGSCIATSWEPPQLLSILGATLHLFRKWKIGLVTILCLLCTIKCTINSGNATSIYATHTHSVNENVWSHCTIPSHNIQTHKHTHTTHTHTHTHTHTSSVVNIIECVSSSHWGILMLLYGHFWSEWVWIRLECMCTDENCWDGVLQWLWKSLMAMVMLSGLSCSLRLHRLTAAHSHWTLCLADKLNSQ